MKNYASIGYPIINPIYQTIHKNLFQITMNFNATHKMLNVRPVVLLQTVNQLRQLDGFFVLPPYNQTIISHLDRLSENASIYNYVDVVKNENGVLVGYCACAKAFKTIADELEEDLLVDRPNVKNQSVLFYGCNDLIRAFGKYATIFDAHVGFATTKYNLSQTIQLLRSLIKKHPMLRSSISDFSEIAATPIPTYTLIFVNLNQYEETYVEITDEMLKRADFLINTSLTKAGEILLERAKKLTITKKAVGGLSVLVNTIAVAHEIWSDQIISNPTLLEVEKSLI